MDVCFVERKISVSLIRILKQCKPLKCTQPVSVLALNSSSAKDNTHAHESTLCTAAKLYYPFQSLFFFNVLFDSEE